MAYDYFSDTPFDLNHDGKIDSNEAAYIYENFFNEDNNIYADHEEGDVEDACDQHNSDTFQRIGSRENNYSADVDELIKVAKKEDYHKNLFIISVVVVLLILFPSSPGVGLFVGGILLILKLSNGF